MQRRKTHAVLVDPPVQLDQLDGASTTTSSTSTIPTSPSTSPPPGTTYTAYMHHTPSNAPPPQPCKECGETTIWADSRVQADTTWRHQYACIAGCRPPLCDSYLDTSPTTLDYPVRLASFKPLFAP